MKNIKFTILRFDYEKHKKPYFDDFIIEIRTHGMMILDGLNQIRWEQDGTLSYRRSCREGVCGSDGININGANLLSCITHIEDVSINNSVTIRPLPGLPIIKDLVVDFSTFFEKYFTIKPFVITKTRPPEHENLQSPIDRKKIDGLYECILCGCCSSACPSYWNDKKFLGPSALINAWRFIEDSRDDGKEERLRLLNNRHGVWRCHTIMNCIEACPKGLNPTRAIKGIKQALLSYKI